MCKTKKRKKIITAKIRSRLLKTKTSFYHTISNGKKRVYTDKDAVKGYRGSRILNPKSVSLINLFVNGVIQPQIIYKIKTGRLKFCSKDLPVAGTPIIIEFVKIYS
ncbi:hypothetical protein D3C73_647280 [compost metagenome]